MDNNSNFRNLHPWDVGRLNDGIRPGHSINVCQGLGTSIEMEISGFALRVRQERGAQPQTFWSGYLPAGWGSSTWRGGGQRVWHVPRNPWNRKFWWDIPGFCRDIPRVHTKGVMQQHAS